MVPVASGWGAVEVLPRPLFGSKKKACCWVKFPQPAFLVYNITVVAVAVAVAVTAVALCTGVPVALYS